MPKTDKEQLSIREEVVQKETLTQSVSVPQTNIKNYTLWQSKEMSLLMILI